MSQIHYASTTNNDECTIEYTDDTILNLNSLHVQQIDSIASYVNSCKVEVEKTMSIVPNNNSPPSYFSVVPRDTARSVPVTEFVKLAKRHYYLKNRTEGIDADMKSLNALNSIRRLIWIVMGGNEMNPVHAFSAKATTKEEVIYALGEEGYITHDEVLYTIKVADGVIVYPRADSSV